MYIQFRDCGHREFFPPHRSAHVRQMDGKCYKCRREELRATIVTVHKRRALFVEVEEKTTNNLRRK